MWRSARCVDPAKCIAASMKNRRPDRTGHGARSRVFGLEERFLGSVLDAVLDSGNSVELEQVTLDPVFRRMWEIRSAAQEAMAEMDANDRWRRAISSGLTCTDKVWQPGAQVFF